MFLHKISLQAMVSIVVVMHLSPLSLSIYLSFFLRVSLADEPSILSESDIELLVSMGFSREQAQQALRESRGNVELAANRLLESI